MSTLSIYICLSPIHLVVSSQLSFLNIDPFSSKYSVFLKPNLSFLEIFKFLIFVLLGFVSLITPFFNIFFFHYNYNSFSYRLLHRLFNKSVILIDDGSNSLLIPFRGFHYSALFTYYNHLTLFSDRIYDLPSISCFSVNKYSNKAIKPLCLDHGSLNLDLKYILIAGADYSDVSLFDENVYLKCLTSLISYLTSNYPDTFLLYYPHRRESQAKLHSIDSLDNIRCLISEFPVEKFVSASILDIFFITSFSSSFEVTLPKLCDNQIGIISVRLPFQHFISSYQFEYLILSSGLTSTKALMFNLPVMSDFIIDQHCILTSSTNFLQKEIVNNQFISIDNFYPDFNKELLYSDVKWLYHPFLSSGTSLYIWRPFLSNVNIFFEFNPKLLAFYVGKVEPSLFDTVML